MRGIVKEYNRKRHFGFIRCVGSESHGKRVYCNRENLRDVKYLIKNDTVEFIISKDGHARDIFLISKEILDEKIK